MNHFLCILLWLLCAGISNAQQDSTDCGTERWDVKTLSDPDTLLVRFDSVVIASVADLARLPALHPRTSSPRLPEERIVYRCRALAYEKRSGDDGDIHLVLRDLETDSTLVAEMPNPDCPEVQRTSRGEIFRSVRRWVNDSLVLPAIVEVVGVAFIDSHHQKGRAANGYELHPVLFIGAPTVSGVEWEERVEYLQMRLSER